MAEQIEINATNSGGNFKLLDAGTYTARCFSMIHIGTIEESFEGKSKESNKVRLTWELPTELKEFKESEGEKPYFLSKDFTLSMHEKASLRKFLESWRGKGFSEEEAKKFNIVKLIGVACMLNVIHKPKKDGNMRLDIASIMPMPKGMKAPDAINENVIFSINTPDMELMSTFPDFIQDKIKSSKEYKLLSLVGSKKTDNNITENTDTDENSLPF